LTPALNENHDELMARETLLVLEIWGYSRKFSCSEKDWQYYWSYPYSPETVGRRKNWTTGQTDRSVIQPSEKFVLKPNYLNNPKL